MADFSGFLTAFQAARDAGKGSTQPGVGRGRGTPEPEDDEPSYEPYPWAHRRKKRGGAGAGSGQRPEGERPEGYSPEELEPYLPDGRRFGTSQEFPDPGWIYNHNTGTYEMADGSKVRAEYDDSGPPPGTGRGTQGRQ